MNADEVREILGDVYIQMQLGEVLREMARTVVHDTVVQMQLEEIIKDAIIASLNEELNSPLRT